MVCTGNVCQQRKYHMPTSSTRASDASAQHSDQRSRTSTLCRRALLRLPLLLRWRLPPLALPALPLAPNMGQQAGHGTGAVAQRPRGVRRQLYGCQGGAAAGSRASQDRGVDAGLEQACRKRVLHSGGVPVWQQTHAAAGRGRQARRPTHSSAPWAKPLASPPNSSSSPMWAYCRQAMIGCKGVVGQRASWPCTAAVA